MRVEHIRLSNSVPRAAAGATRAPVVQGGQLPQCHPCSKRGARAPQLGAPHWFKGLSLKRKMRTDLSPKTPTNAGQPGGNTNPPQKKIHYYRNQIKSGSWSEYSRLLCLDHSLPQRATGSCPVTGLPTPPWGPGGCTAHLWVALQGQSRYFLALRPWVSCLTSPSWSLHSVNGELLMTTLFYYMLNWGVRNGRGWG